MKTLFRGAKQKRLLKYCFIFLFSVFAFAGLYYTIFQINTASFYISEEYNERVNGRYLRRSPDVLYTIVDRSENPFCIDDFNQEIKPINDNISNVYKELDSLHASIKYHENILERLSVSLAESRTDHIEKYKNDQLQPCRDSVTAYESRIEDLLRLGISEDQLILNGTFVRLANMKYRLAKKNSEVCNQVLANYGNFGNQKLADSLQNTVTLLLEMSNRIGGCENTKRELFAMYDDMLHAFHSQRIEKMGYCDFLHFSLLIATSNSFGDILPNSPISRLLVSIQLLIGIVLLAFIVNDVYQSKKQ